ncbi:MAG: DUF4365 domain-containing protein [Hormoscilla sp. GUM202]|nr:DUF4365 domain-containing protein [Hormoscilla sp. GUM202]
MDLNTQKEECSYAYIYTVASAAGYSFQRASSPLDKVGIDAIVTGLGVQGEQRSFPQVHLQVKSTSRNVLADREIRYPLRVIDYERLRDNNRVIPLILVLILFPENVEEWLHQSERELCLKSCGYWMSLQGSPGTENKETVTVYVPRKNLFTVDAMKRIMQRIGAGERL